MAVFSQLFVNTLLSWDSFNCNHPTNIGRYKYALKHYCWNENRVENRLVPTMIHISIPSKFVSTENFYEQRSESPILQFFMSKQVTISRTRFRSNHWQVMLASSLLRLWCQAKAVVGMFNLSEHVQNPSNKQIWWKSWTNPKNILFCKASGLIFIL